MRYKLLIDSTRGRAGHIVEIDPSEAETLAILQRNGVIGEPFDDVVQKVSSPEIVKVVGPDIVKRRGRPRKADNASDTQD
jgi:hypothetical protein